MLHDICGTETSNTLDTLGLIIPNTLSLNVKFFCHLFQTNVSSSVVLMAISAISKYPIIDKNTGTPIGQHPLVTTANKVFWQQRPPIPRYHGTYDVSTLLRFIESFGENETLTLKQLSENTAFLVTFSTLSRYCLALTLDQIYLPKLFVIFPLPYCPTQSEQCVCLGGGDLCGIGWSRSETC